MCRHGPGGHGCERSDQFNLYVLEAVRPVRALSPDFWWPRHIRVCHEYTVSRSRFVAELSTTPVTALPWRRVLGLDAGARRCRTVLLTSQAKDPATIREPALRIIGGVGGMDGVCVRFVAVLSSSSTAAPAGVTRMSVAAMHAKTHKRHGANDGNKDPVTGHEVQHLHHPFSLRPTP